MVLFSSGGTASLMKLNETKLKIKTIKGENMVKVTNTGEGPLTFYDINKKLIRINNGESIECEVKDNKIGDPRLVIEDIVEDKPKKNKKKESE